MPSNPAVKVDLRREARHPLSGMLRILWEDSDGREVISKAQIVDVSVSGLKLRVEGKIPVRTYISCNDTRLGIRGRGSVRYCHFAKNQFLIGIEFPNGTGWRPPSSDTAHS